MNADKLIELEVLLQEVQEAVAELRRTLVARSVATGSNVMLVNVATKELTNRISSLLAHAFKLAHPGQDPNPGG